MNVILLIASRFTKDVEKMAAFVSLFQILYVTPFSKKEAA